MILPHRSQYISSPALRRLSSIGPLDMQAIKALEAAMATRRTIRPRRELLGDGHEITETKLIVSGWAARAHILADGRRQLLDFLLPGDLVGFCRQTRPVSTSTVIALTEVSVCAAPRVDTLPALAEVYALAQALEEARLLAHITRLGRLNAQERISDLLLELHERLEPTGLVHQNGFDLPTTQEALGDALGLTSVHVNRMLQLMRREGGIELKNGRVTLADPAALARRIGRVRQRVSAAGQTTA